jgi:hypothetical protein
VPIHVLTAKEKRSVALASSYAAPVAIRNQDRPDEFRKRNLSFVQLLNRIILEGWQLVAVVTVVQFLSETNTAQRSANSFLPNAKKHSPSVGTIDCYGGNATLSHQPANILRL